MVDRVVLQRLDQTDEVVRFRNEHAVLAEHGDDAESTSWMFSMCAKTLVAVTTVAAPCSARTRAATPGPKNSINVGNAPLGRDLAISVGSIPSTRWPPFLKLLSSVPSFDPTSTARSDGPRPSIADASR